MELGNKGISITMLCIGPVFSNIITNAFTGKIDQKTDKLHEAQNKRMNTSRCAYLMAVSIINRMDESWISLQPVLTMHYLCQYMPSFTRKILPRFLTVERMNRIREGDRN